MPLIRPALRALFVALIQLPNMARSIKQWMKVVCMALLFSPPSHPLVLAKSNPRRTPRTYTLSRSHSNTIQQPATNHHYKPLVLPRTPRRSSDPVLRDEFATYSIRQLTPRHFARHPSRGSSCSSRGDISPSTSQISSPTLPRTPDDASAEIIRLKDEAARYEYLWREELQRHAETRKQFTTSLSFAKQQRHVKSVLISCSTPPASPFRRTFVESHLTSDCNMDTPLRMKRLSFQTRIDKENLNMSNLSGEWRKSG
jgi:hypothetical protein